MFCCQSVWTYKLKWKEPPCHFVLEYKKYYQVFIISRICCVECDLRYNRKCIMWCIHWLFYMMQERSVGCNHWVYSSSVIIECNHIWKSCVCFKSGVNYLSWFHPVYYLWSFPQSQTIKGSCSGRDMTNSSHVELVKYLCTIQGTTEIGWQLTMQTLCVTSVFFVGFSIEQVDRLIVDKDIMCYWVVRGTSRQVDSWQKHYVLLV